MRCHEHNCNHLKVEYCSGCRKVFCRDCKMSWQEECKLNHYYPQYIPWTSTGIGIRYKNTDGSDGIGYFSKEEPLTVTCSHT